MMKLKIFLGMMLCLALLALASCNDSFLDQTQTSSLDKDVVFGDSTFATGFLSEIYYNIGFDTNLDRFGNGGLQVACDEAEFKQSSDISTGMAFATGTINPRVVTNDAWSTCYKNIRACNIFLKNIDKTPMAEGIKKQYTAECRFLRAWYYFILLRHYGGIPLLGDTIYNATDKMKSTRDTYADCVDYIGNEVKSVLAENVLHPRTTGHSNGRISEAVCKAFLSRLYLYAASPLYNGSGFGTDSTKLLLGYPTYDKERWHDAYDYAKQAMAMDGDFKLFEDNYVNDDQSQYENGWGYYAIMQPADFINVTNNGQFAYGAYQEVILEQKRKEGIAVCQLLDPVSCGGNGNGGYIYSDLADAFPMLDGKPIGESKYTYDPTHPNVNRDPRFANTVIYDGTKVYSAGDANHIVYTRTGDGKTQDAVHNGTPTGLFIRKLLHRGAAGNWWIEPPQSRSLIRFAEVMLNYAEAANEYYGPNFTEQLGTHTMGPLEVLKLIRERAGIEAGDNGMYGLKANMTQDEMREAIRNERRIELAFEGFRFFDVRRWMIADQTENKDMHGLEITSSNGNLSANEFVVRKHVFRKAMYFFPIPYDEIVKTPGLIQNPYYE